MPGHANDRPFPQLNLSSRCGLASVRSGGNQQRRGWIEMDSDGAFCSYGVDETGAKYEDTPDLPV